MPFTPYRLQPHLAEIGRERLVPALIALLDDARPTRELSGETEDGPTSLRVIPVGEQVCRILGELLGRPLQELLGVDAQTPAAALREEAQAWWSER